MEPKARTFHQSINSKLEPKIKNHLKNVYGCLSLSAIAAVVGAYIHMFTTLLPTGLVTVFGLIGFLALLGTKDENGKNRCMRFGCLLCFTFCMGHSLGPLLKEALNVDASIIMTPLIATAVIFVSFTFSALLASRGSYFYYGELAMAGLNTLILLSIMNLFTGSELIEESLLYFTLVVMFLFVLYDTQIIVERRRNGDNDFVAHSLVLFLDVFDIFVSLLKIFIRNEQKKRNKEQNRKWC